MRSLVKNPNSTQFTHAGAVVFRGAPQAPEFLLVSPKDNSTEWVLPKGHIDSGEDPPCTAIREVLEESGVNAELISDNPLGSVQFTVEGQDVHVVYFLARSI